MLLSSVLGEIAAFVSFVDYALNKSFVEIVMAATSRRKWNMCGKGNMSQ
ncbi:MAG: hypothetical protein K6T72_12840 [Anoxybacillus sp.]|nr:hypothetical protein [Anoxybacillus sp.]MCL6587372.1 hypothetical protein [Anoxybacillus sp.]